MTTTDTITPDAAVTILTAEGHTLADVLAALDSLIAAGVDHAADDGSALLTGDDLDVVRKQLSLRGGDADATGRR